MYCTFQLPHLCLSLRWLRRLLLLYAAAFNSHRQLLMPGWPQLSPLHFPPKNCLMGLKLLMRSERLAYTQVGHHKILERRYSQEKLVNKWCTINIQCHQRIGLFSTNHWLFNVKSLLNEFYFRGFNLKAKFILRMVPECNHCMGMKKMGVGLTYPSPFSKSLTFRTCLFIRVERIA